MCVLVLHGHMCVLVLHGYMCVLVLHVYMCVLVLHGHMFVLVLHVHMCLPPIFGGSVLLAVLVFFVVFLFCMSSSCVWCTKCC